MKEQEFIYIKKDDPQSVETIKNNIKPTDHIFIFPEGTLINKNLLNSRNQNCLRKNIKPYKNVLFPKEKGFNTIKEILKPEYITNITFKYILHDNKKVQELDESIFAINIYDARFIKKIIVIVDKIKVDDNTNINDIFREKDELIDQLN